MTSDIPVCFNCGTRYYTSREILRLGNFEICTKCLKDMFKTGELELVYNEDKVPRPETRFNPSRR